MMRVALFLTLAACTWEGGYGGASGAGNPGSAAQRTAKGSDVDIDVAMVFTEALVIDPCEGDVVRVDIGEEVDLLEGAAVEVPGGRWCGLSVLWRPPMIVEGRAKDDEGGSFTLELDATGPSFTLNPAFELDGDALIVELGSNGWVAKEDLGLATAEHVDVAPGDPLHDELVESIELGSALILDANEDGRVQGGERNMPLAVGPEWDDEEEDDT